MQLYIFFALIKILFQLHYKTVLQASETDLSALKELKKQSSEVSFAVLDEKDQSPEELKYYGRLKKKQERRRVRRSALEVAKTYKLKIL